LQHARYCLRAAIRASVELAADEALRAEWQDRLDHMAPDIQPYFGNRYDASLQGLEKWCDECSPPQWGRGRPYHLPSPSLGPASAAVKERLGAWWLCHPGGAISAMRDGTFVPDRDGNILHAYVESAHHCNGFIYKGSPCGHELVFNEELGIAAALQEMMLQSWDGALRIFPAPRAHSWSAPRGRKVA
jgi:hypothetical protein